MSLQRAPAVMYMYVLNAYKYLLHQIHHIEIFITSPLPAPVWYFLHLSSLESEQGWDLMEPAAGILSFRDIGEMKLIIINDSSLFQ